MTTVSALGKSEYGKNAQAKRRVYTEFDEGHLSKDPASAQDEIDKTLAVMDDTRPPKTIEDNAIRYVFQITWDRLKKV